MEEGIKVIVLTPVKNEDWIIDQFLKVTSMFADCIIVADQNSTDETKSICLRYPKVYLIENKKQEFNEAGRQLLLIKTARLLFPNAKRILLALDADEIFAADSLKLSVSWNKIKASKPGTTVCFEKPDILPGIEKCIRYKDKYFPIGYVDDEIEHKPRKIHSKRIPGNVAGTDLNINDIKILHFARSRKNVQSAKLRYYSVIENINKTTSVYLRRNSYKCFFDPQTFYSLASTENIPEQWLSGWDENKIELRNFLDPAYSWHDFEVLRFFRKFGYRRFYFEDIWCFDWETCRQKGLQLNKEVPSEKIRPPGKLIKFTSKALDVSYRLFKRLKKFQ